MSTSFRTEDDGLSWAIAFSGTDNITLKQTSPELTNLTAFINAKSGL